MDQPTPPYLLTDTAAPPQSAWRRWRWFGLFVLLPTALAAIWLFVFAADQYESEAQFVVRSSDVGAGTAGAGGLAQMIGLGSAGAGAGEAQSVAAYLLSHDAVQAADARLDLSAMFRRPEADILSRLWTADPEAEELVEDYRDRVDVIFDQDTGLTQLEVRTYRPQDSLALANLLLELGEARVNALNERASDAMLASAQEQLALAEGELARIGGGLSAYRQQQREVDPETSGRAGVELAASLRGELAALRAQERGMANTVRADSPQREALRDRIDALAREVAAAEARLAGGANALAARVGDYEDLRLRQEFAAQRYELAAAAFEKARDQALRQNLFIVRVVEPNLPEKALYPRRFTILATLFAGLTLAYGIGWLILAGVREHAA